MTQYNTLNVKLSNSQLNKLKSGIVNGTEVTLKLLPDVFNNNTNFLNKLLLINTQILRLHKSFTNASSANTKLSKTQLHKIGQSKGFLDRLWEPLLKNGSSLIKNVLKPLVTSFLILLGLTAGAVATDASIHKNNFRIGYDYAYNLKWRNELYLEIC